MLFITKKEINFELLYNVTLKRILINKNNYSNKYLIKKPNIKLFFWFKRIKEEELNLIKIYNHSLFFWLIAGQTGKIKNLNSTLHRGIRYYRCIFFLNLNIKFYFKFINFLNEILLPVMQKNTFKQQSNIQSEIIYTISDLNSFTNMRLSTNLYLNSIHDKLYLSFSKINNLNEFLNILKIKNNNGSK